MNNCTNCGTAYEGYACPRCGMLSGSNQQQNRLCLGCGVSIPTSYNNCPHCGKPQDQPVQQPQGQYTPLPQGQYPPPPMYPAPVYAPVPPAPPKSGHGKVLLVLVIAVIIIIAAIAAAVLLMGVTDPFKNAKVVVDGDTISGDISRSGSDDLYKIKLESGEKLRATLIGPGGTDFDLYAYENVQFWDEYIITASASETSSETFDLVAWQDDYYIIDVYSYEGSGDYTLSLDVISTIDLNDGDNSLTDANPIASGDTITGNLNEYYDADDYYKIYVGQGQILHAFLEVPVQLNTDFDLYIYDSQGTELGISEEAYGNEELSVYATSGGYYFVNAWAYDGIGKYSLYVDILSGTGSDSNNDLGSAEATHDGAHFSASINEYDDTDDYYSIHLNADQTLTVMMTGPSDADFDLYLLDEDGYEVASSGDYTSSEQIVYTALNSGTYYINPYAYSGFGTYTLDISTGSGTSLNADAGFDRTVGISQTVSFNGASSTGSITSYSWNFGDGASGTGKTATHTYTSTGTYTVTLTVSDSTSTDSDTMTITVSDSGSASGKYALVIGISDYQGDGDLEYCDEDAASWTSYLQAQGYTVHTLIDSQASTSGIMDGIDWLEAQEEAGDYVAFIFSGHGSYSDRTRSSYICAWNIEEQDGFISDAQLGEAFDNFDSQHIFFFFDSCHSGGMDSVAGPGRYVSETAGQLEYGLDDSKSQHGMWTYWFLVYAVEGHGNSDMTRAYDVAYPRAVADAASGGNAMHPEEEWGGTSFYL